MPEDIKKQYLIDGAIEKLEVFQGEKRWVFSISLPKPMPYPAYQLFISTLKNGLAHIAKVEIKLTYTEEIQLSQYIGDYWPYIVEQLRPYTNGLIKRLQEQLPATKGKKLIIEVLN